MHSSHRWRDVLGTVASVAQNKQRLLQELGVSSLTLSRWISGESRPRPSNLRLLLHALPEHRIQFLAMWEEEFGTAVVHDILSDTIQHEISSLFYTQILHMHAHMFRLLHFRTICELILQQALEQLDPNRAGLYLAVMRCTPPTKGHKVRSVYESVWTMTFADETMPIRPFFGREALVGEALNTGRAQIIHSRQEGVRQFPHGWWGIMESAIAYPIHIADRFAGCLLIYSFMPGYFWLSSRQTLVQHYANLIAIAFEAEDFYAYDEIDIVRMPYFDSQRAITPSYHQRLAMIMSEEDVNHQEAERLVIQQLEKDLLS